MSFQQNTITNFADFHINRNTLRNFQICFNTCGNLEVHLNVPIVMVNGFVCHYG